MESYALHQDCLMHAWTQPVQHVEDHSLEGMSRV